MEVVDPVMKAELLSRTFLEWLAAVENVHHRPALEPEPEPQMQLARQRRATSKELVAAPEHLVKQMLDALAARATERGMSTNQLARVEIAQVERGGRLSMRQLQRVLVSLNVRVTKQEQATLFSFFNADSNGTISSRALLRLSLIHI